MSSVPAVEPAAGSPRIVGIDLARMLALLGMMAAHLIGDQRETHPAWTLVDGRSSGLFCVLAGVAVALVTGRERPLRGRALHLRAAGLVLRAAVVLALGLWLARLDHGVMVILPVYGLLFCLALPFLRLGWRALAALAAGWAVASPLLSQALRPHLGTGPSADESLPAGVEQAVELLLFGGYPAFTWLSLLLAGMAVGRLPLHRPGVAARVAALGAALAGLTVVASRWLEGLPGVREALWRSWLATPWMHRLDLDDLDADPASPDAFEAALRESMHGVHPTDTPAWQVVLAPHAGTVMTLLHTIGTSLLVLGACVLLVEGSRRVWGGAARAWQIAAGAGAMTLTLYTLHILMLTPLLPPGDEYADLLPQWLVVVALGAAFALAGARGPLEQLTHLLAGLPQRLATRR